MLAIIWLTNATTCLMMLCCVAKKQNWLFFQPFLAEKNLHFISTCSINMLIILKICLLFGIILRDWHLENNNVCKKQNKTKRTKDRCQNWKPGFNWYCSTVIILKGIVWSNTCNVSTHSSLSYRIIGLSFCIEQYIQCEINTFTQMDIIVGAHLYDTRHKNIQVIVSFFFFHLLMWSTSKIYGHVFNNTNRVVSHSQLFSTTQGSFYL